MICPGLWKTSKNAVVELHRYNDCWVGLIIDNETGKILRGCTFTSDGYAIEPPNIGYLVQRQRSLEERGWPIVQAFDREENVE